MADSPYRSRFFNLDKKIIHIIKHVVNKIYCQIFSFLAFACFACLAFACSKVNSRASQDYSKFRLVYSYEPNPIGDRKYKKLIKHLSAQHKLSLYCHQYVYYYNGHYYVFAKQPLTAGGRTRNPIVISAADADEIMTR